MNLESSVKLTPIKQTDLTASTSSIIHRKRFCELGPKQRGERAQVTCSHYDSGELLEATYFK